MRPGYTPKIQMGTNFSAKGPGMMQGHITKNAFAQGSEKPSFHGIMMDTLGKVNEVAKAPDAMLQEAITTGAYDVHDVMMASAKAELAVTIASQITTKVVQAYDKILQIQV